MRFSSYRAARCERIRAGAALVLELIAQVEGERRYAAAHRCYTIESEEFHRVRELEQLHGLLIELASEQLLD